MPNPSRILADMRRVYRGVVKEDGASPAQRVLLAQFRDRPADFMKDLQRLEREHQVRLNRYAAKASKSKVAKESAVTAEAAASSLEPTADMLRELCDRLVADAARAQS